VGACAIVTGEEEGYMLEGTPYGTFEQLRPVVRIYHLSAAGERIFARLGSGRTAPKASAAVAGARAPAVSEQHARPVQFAARPLLSESGRWW
jgi:hypothetical protein